MLFFIPSLRGQIPRSPAEEEAGLAVHDPRAKLSPSNQGDLNFFCLCFFHHPLPRLSLNWRQHDVAIISNLLKRRHPVCHPQTNLMTITATDIWIYGRHVCT